MAAAICFLNVCTVHVSQEFLHRETHAHIRLVHVPPNTTAVCQPHTERQMRKELSHHTMSARARTAAGSRERGWSRATSYQPEVFCERPLSNKPVRSRTRTRSFGLSHGLCSVLECLNGFRCVTGCHLFHCIFGSTSNFYPQGDPGKPRAVATRRPCHLSQDTEFLSLVSQSVLSSKTHEFFGFSQSVLTRKTLTNLVACLLSITSQPQRGRGAAAPRGFTAPL